MVNQKTLSREVLMSIGALALGMLFVLAFPVQSEARKGTYASSTATTTLGVGKNVDLTCMAAAVDAREDAVMDAWEDFSSSTVSALGVRKTALHTAWGMTEMKARTAAVVSAWKAWRTASMIAHKELRSDRKAAWDAFKNTAKSTCKMKTPKEESDGAAAKDTIVL